MQNQVSPGCCVQRQPHCKDTNTWGHDVPKRVALPQGTQARCCTCTLSMGQDRVFCMQEGGRSPCLPGWFTERVAGLPPLAVRFVQWVMFPIVEGRSPEMVAGP